MPSLRVGVVIRWPEVETELQAMLEALGHQFVGTGADEDLVPDVVIRDATCKLPTGWADCPVVMLSDSWVDVAEKRAGEVRLLKPFSREQLKAAIRIAAFGGTA